MRHKIILVLVSVFLFFAILGVSMSVSKVTVTGNRSYTAEQIEQLVFPTRISRNCSPRPKRKLRRTKPSLKSA